MNHPLCAVVLAAGEGTRLRPLTDVHPKPLCPVGNITLLDRTLTEVAQLGLVGPANVAVNAYHLAAQIEAAAIGRARVSVEAQLLGTAGTVAALADWIGDRDAVIFNADAYRAGASIEPTVASWDGIRPRLLVHRDTERPDFNGQWRFAGVSLLPAAWVEKLRRGFPHPTATPGLYEQVWREVHAAGELEFVEYSGTFIDCGTPADYLAANLDALTSTPGLSAGGNLVGPDAAITGTASGSVIGPRARVAGTITASVIWPDAEVAANETLIRTIRTPTVSTSG